MSQSQAQLVMPLLPALKRHVAWSTLRRSSLAPPMLPVKQTHLRSIKMWMMRKLNVKLEPKRARQRIMKQLSRLLRSSRAVCATLNSSRWSQCIWATSSISEILKLSMNLLQRSTVIWSLRRTASEYHQPTWRMCKTEPKLRILREHSLSSGSSMCIVSSVWTLRPSTSQFSWSTDSSPSSASGRISCTSSVSPLFLSRPSMKKFIHLS